MCWITDAALDVRSWFPFAPLKLSNRLLLGVLNSAGLGNSSIVGDGVIGSCRVGQ